MKLLISTAYYYPHISGLTNSIKNLAEELVKSDFEIKILTAKHKKDTLTREKINNVDIVRVPYLFRISKGFFMPEFLLSAFKEVKRSDNVLINLPQFEGFLVAMLAKLMKKKVYCIYVCDVILKKGFFTKIIEGALGLSNKICLNLSNSVITLTDDFYKNNRTLTKLNKKIYTIFPIVKSPKLQIDNRQELKDKLPKKKYLIGFVGRISHEKGIEYLLDAIPHLQKKLGNDFSIIMVGPKEIIGEENYIKKINTLMQNFPDFCVQLGEIDDGALGVFYSLIDVLVLPSTDLPEVFGMVQIEAMFCGAPVVASDLPGVRVPVSKTGMGEIVRTGDSLLLASAIAKVVLNKNKYIKKPEEIASYFSVKKIIQQWREILN